MEITQPSTSVVNLIDSHNPKDNSNYIQQTNRSYEDLKTNFYSAIKKSSEMVAEDEPNRIHSRRSSLSIRGKIHLKDQSVSLDPIEKHSIGLSSISIASSHKTLAPNEPLTIYSDQYTQTPKISRPSYQIQT